MKITKANHGKNSKTDDPTKNLIQALEQETERLKNDRMKAKKKVEHLIKEFKKIAKAK